MDDPFGGNFPGVEFSGVEISVGLNFRVELSGWKGPVRGRVVSKVSSDHHFSYAYFVEEVKLHLFP